MAQKFYIVIQDPDRPLLRETVVYLNTRGGTDMKTGEYIPPVCKGVDPDGLGIYVVDSEAEYAKEKTMALERAQRNAATRLLGPYSTRDEAIQAEMRARPKTVDQKLALANAENARLKAELEAAKAGKGDKEPAAGYGRTK